LLIFTDLIFIAAPPTQASQSVQELFSTHDLSLLYDYRGPISRQAFGLYTRAHASVRDRPSTKQRCTRPGGVYPFVVMLPLRVTDVKVFSQLRICAIAQT
jgi:hypothetical protein